MKSHARTLLLHPGPLVLLAATLLTSAAGCSRQQPPDSVAPLPASPPVAPAAGAKAGEALTGTAAEARQTDAAPPGAKADEVLTATITAGGVHATYRAFFADNQLKRITETRDFAAAQAEDSAQRHNREGEYEFYGARLTKYTGASLSGSGMLALELDLQGAVTAARADSGEASAGEISAIRTRAQLLRSHALAQRAVRSHGGG